MSLPRYFPLLMLGALALVGSVAGCSGDSGPGVVVPTKDPKFYVGQTRLELPAACAPTPVARRLVEFVRAFNAGETETAARAFQPSGDFHPYNSNGDPGNASLIGRAEIASWLADRHKRGDGWTLTFIWPPLGRAGLPSHTPYGVGIRVSSDGESVFENGSKAVIDCQSGLIIGWVGPVPGPD